MHSILLTILPLLLLHRSTLHPVSATFDRYSKEDQCFASYTCSVDPIAARAAIELIPSLPLLSLDNSSSSSPFSSSSSSSPPTTVPAHQQFNPAIYRLPAIFEASPDAQILVRLGLVRGLELTPQALMTYLWPQAKEAASRVLELCTSRNPGLCGTSAPTLTWPGPPLRELGFRVEVVCGIDPAELPGATTYTPSGVRSGEVLGGGRTIRRPGWGFGMGD